jgi:hypothetical protein
MCHPLCCTGRVRPWNAANIQNTILGLEKILAIITRVLRAVTPYIATQTLQARDPVWDRGLIRLLTVMVQSALDHIVFVLSINHMTMMNICMRKMDGHRFPVAAPAAALRYHRNHPVHPLSFLESGATTRWM